MKRYYGTFKDANEHLISVEILPTKEEYDGNVELHFIYDEPVKIEQKSDNLFAPVKTKSCTITIFTDDIYFDLYTPDARAISVTVTDTTADRKLFEGFMTPCIYSQDYAYKAEIELEAVDALAATKQYDYTCKGYKVENITKSGGTSVTVVTRGECEIISVDEMLQKIFKKVQTVNGVFTKQSDGTYEGSGSYVNDTNFDFTSIYLQEANFFDDDDEPDTLQEILEELCNYLGISVTYYDGNIILYDYNKINNSSDTPITIQKSLYGQGTPTIELDDVYNKISIGCDMYEVEDLVDEIVDEENKTIVNEMKIADEDRLYSDYGYSWREWNHHTKDANRNRILVKPYLLVDETTHTSDASRYIISKWSIPQYIKLDGTELSTAPTASEQAALDVDTYVDGSGDALFVPQYRHAYPTRVYHYTVEEGMESSKNIDWEDYILFPSFNWSQANSVSGRSAAASHITPAIKFTSNENLAYSIPEGKGFIIFNAEIWLQSWFDVDGGDDNDSIWFDGYDKGHAGSSSYSHKFPFPFPVDNLSLSITDKYKNIDGQGDDDTAYKRKSGNTNYNKGWELLTCKLQIGDKYWNGTEWTKTNSTFVINFHDDDVSGDVEYIHKYKWLNPAPNPNLTKLEVGEDGYAIPITAEDNLYGKLEFTIYTPKQLNVTELRKVIPNFFMKDLSLEYVYNNSGWAEDTTEDDDIVYEGVINDDYATEMDELDLKINSWYSNKPISKSYVLNSNYIPIVKLANSRVQETVLVSKYYNHYSTKKQIFTLNYKTTDLNPLNKYKHTITFSDGSTKETVYCIDSYEMDVKTGETNIKLIEV